VRIRPDLLTLAVTTIRQHLRPALDEMITLVRRRGHAGVVGAILTGVPIGSRSKSPAPAGTSPCSWLVEAMLRPSGSPIWASQRVP
jgi:hypothetical protein